MRVKVSVRLFIVYEDTKATYHREVINIKRLIAQIIFLWTMR